METRTALILALAVLLSPACSSVDTVAPGGNRTVTPEQVARGALVPGPMTVEWGGVIIELKNLQQATEIQVIAYPLTRNGRPDTDKPPLGRFIARHEGYLEPIDYARSRELTLSGKIDHLRKGEVGAAPYTFPVLRVEKIQLWPKRYVGDSTPRFNVGFGAGSSGSSVGIGIGF